MILNDICDVTFQTVIAAATNVFFNIFNYKEMNASEEIVKEIQQNITCLNRSLANNGVRLYSSFQIYRNI